MFGRDAIQVQKISYFLCSFAVAHINYRCSWYTVQYFEQLFIFAFGGAHHIGQIGAGEAFLKDVFLTKKKFLLNVDYNFGGSSGSKCQHRNVRKHFANIGDVKVRGSEIVTPLRNTVRFINGNDTNFGLSYFFNKNRS